MKSGRASVRHLRRARWRVLLEIGLAVGGCLPAYLRGQPGAVKQEIVTPLAQITHGLFQRGSARG
jgi:hypothetical protein